MAPLPSVQDAARSEIAIMVEIFERDGDASAAWRAFFLARKYGCEIPDSINAEIDRFAEAVGAVAERAHQGDAKATVDNETVGKIWKGNKGRDPGAAAFRVRRAWDIAVTVEKLRRTGFASADAVALVCKKLAISKTIASNAMAQHHAVRHMSDVELQSL